MFAVSPARDLAPTSYVSFVFTQALHVQSGGGSVQSLSIDFGDGRGYLPAAWGQAIATNYSSVGTKRVRVKVTYLNDLGSTNGLGTSYESHFDLQVLALATSAASATSAAPTTTPGTISSGATTQGTAGTLGAGGVAGYVYPAGTDSVYFAPTANHSGGWAYLVYGGLSRRQLTKPLIVAEGYDPSRIAPDVQRNYNVRDFLRNINVFNNQNGFFDFRTSLGNDAATTGAYDVVFIDYNNGTDDIRRNAALFQQVVQYVNANKQGGTSSGQKNVVLGISMGGLVARYGLAQLEKAQPGSTHTRLLVTHDSPHRGSNTPLGIQALTRQAASTYLGMSIKTINQFGVARFLTGKDIFPQLHQGDLLLDEPATKQLLLVRATVQRFVPFAWASTYGSEYNSFLDGEYRTMITPSAGQSFPYRFIATSLGSQCGRTTLSPY